MKLYSKQALNAIETNQIMTSLNPTNIASQSEYPAVYERFKFFFEDYGDNSLNLLKSVYSEDIQFRDPVHQIKGLSQLSSYFEKGKKSLIMCRFEFTHEHITHDEAFISWNMHFQHKKIKSGKLVVVRGISHIQFADDKVTYHEDSFDLGSMIYENIPVVGKLVSAIKRKL